MKFDGKDPEVQEILQHPFIQEGMAQGCVIRILTARSTRYAYVSPNSTEVLGIRPEDQLGRSCFDFIQPDATPWVRDLMSSSTQGPMESWYQTGADAHGDPIWVRTESMPIGNFIVGRVQVEPDRSHWAMRFEAVEA